MPQMGPFDRIAMLDQPRWIYSTTRSIFSDFLQTPVVIGPSRYEIKAEIEQRLSKHAGRSKKECDQKSTEATISI